MSELEFPVKSYSKSQLYQELKSRQLVIFSYRTFINWVFDDPLSKAVREKPELRRKKVLHPKYIQLILDAII